MKIDSAKVLCAIPARGGSKRLPRKNVKSLAGKPMLAYSIEAAKATGLFEQIFVCTEDEEIAAVAKQYGAEVPYLMPPELCGDAVPSHSPCAHLASHLLAAGQPLETLLCLQPTSPLRSASDIFNGLNYYLEGSYKFVLSGTPIDPHYFHWALSQDENGAWTPFFGSKYMVERIYLPTVLRPNGSIKIANLSALRETGNFFGEGLGVFETPEERSVHVGTEYDFKMCEWLLEQQ
jgi:CMP-N-acetylneuraminic acid synthetase